MDKQETKEAIDYVRVIIDQDFNFSMYFDSVFVWLFVVIVSVFFVGYLVSRYFNLGSWHSFEIDEAEIGIGNQKLTIRPNNTDRQIAYQIWVELSTRKIGLPIDFDNDVIAEVYDSWYNFFSVTRGLIKEVPVTKFRRKDTEQIIRLGSVASIS